MCPALSVCGASNAAWAFAGTATHLAPELLRAGTRITTAADVYAWGIMMVRRALVGSGAELHPLPCVQLLVARAAQPNASQHATPSPQWECYTAKRAFAGLPRATVVRVLQQGARPSFPAGTPPAFADLAAACWAPSPGDRPGFAEVIARLHTMADGLAAQA